MNPEDKNEPDPWRTSEELAAHYMSLFEYYKDQCDKKTAQIAIITQVFFSLYKYLLGT